MRTNVNDLRSPRVVGLLPDNVTQEQAYRIADRVNAAFVDVDGSTVRALRIVPSSVVRSDVTIEFVANTTVEPKNVLASSPAGRSKVIDSVVTLDLTSGEVTNVRIPFLERVLA